MVLRDRLRGKDRIRMGVVVEGVMRGYVVWRRFEGSGNKGKQRGIKLPRAFLLLCV
jgi:hypothetical protein